MRCGGSLLGGVLIGILRGDEGGGKSLCKI